MRIAIAPHVARCHWGIDHLHRHSLHNKHKTRRRLATNCLRLALHYHERHMSK